MTATAVAATNAREGWERYARTGLWLLPVYGALLALGTLTAQPDYETDFQDYAEYVTTDVFLVSHLGASIAGAALGLLGIVAALAYLVRGPAVTSAVLGASAFVIGNVLFTALFGVAAFAQPAIGDAFLGGMSGVRELNDDVYGPALVATAGVGFLFFLAGAILLGIAIAKVSHDLKWIGVAFAATLVLFVLGFVFLRIAQPVGGALFCVVAVLLARRLPASSSRVAPGRAP